jgi:predicted nucleotidyltransferase
MQQTIDPFVLQDVPGTTALLGVAGSHAFGMATAASDVDYRGCYVIPTRELFRLVTPDEAFNRNDPDVAMHEVGRLLRQACAANPTALESLFYTYYVIQDDIGRMLLSNREMFLTNRIRDTHLGFAESQFKKMQTRWNPSYGPPDDKRAIKHARHTYRVIRLTERVLTTGEYNLVEPDPDAVFAFGELDYAEKVRKAAVEITRIRKIDSVLPDGPDLAKVDELLVEIREMSL